MTITGRTRCFPLIGFPVEQVRTPPGINAWFAANGVDAVMFPLDIAPAQAASFFTLLRSWNNAGGCSVTVPHKQAALRAMDDISDRARRSGSVNIVRRDADGRLIGDMTDGLAFVEALRRNDVPLAGASAVVVGAGGGAGAAIADSLCAAGLAEIALVDTDPARSQAVTDTLRAAYPDVAVSDAPVAGRRYDLAVNATPLGMRPGDPLPFDVAITADDGVVADVVTKPEMTALILAARRTGRRVQTGIQMADAQLEFQMRHLGLSRGDATLSPVSKRGRMP